MVIVAVLGTTQKSLFFLGKKRQTNLNLQEYGEFTLALANMDTMVGADYVEEYGQWTARAE